MLFYFLYVYSLTRLPLFISPLKCLDHVVQAGAVGARGRRSFWLPNPHSWTPLPPLGPSYPLSPFISPPPTPLRILRHQLLSNLRTIHCLDVCIRGCVCTYTGRLCAYVPHLRVHTRSRFGDLCFQIRMWQLSTAKCLFGVELSYTLWKLKSLYIVVDCHSCSSP